MYYKRRSHLTTRHTRLINRSMNLLPPAGSNYRRDRQKRQLDDFHQVVFVFKKRSEDLANDQSLSFDPKLLSNISVLTNRKLAIHQFILVSSESHEKLSSISFHSELHLNQVIQCLIKPRARSYFSIWEEQRYLRNISMNDVK